MVNVKRQSLLLLFLLAVLFLAAAASYSLSAKGITSVEVRVAELSPKGVNGGAVIPASCPSYAHTPGECTDLCPNIAGVQSSVPAGYHVDGSGNCVPDVAETCSVGASPNPINAGDSTTLTWSCSQSSTASSNFTSGMAGSGSFTVSPTGPTTYSLQCGGGCSTTVQVNVNSPTLQISATPTRVRSGNASIISWNATSVTSCSLSPAISAPCSGASCANAHTPSTGPLTQQTIYTLTCQGSTGAQSATATVFITPSTCEVGTANCPN